MPRPRVPASRPRQRRPYRRPQRRKRKPIRMASGNLSHREVCHFLLARDSIILGRTTITNSLAPGTMDCSPVPLGQHLHTAPPFPHGPRFGRGYAHLYRRPDAPRGDRLGGPRQGAQHGAHRQGADTTSVSRQRRPTACSMSRAATGTPLRRPMTLATPSTRCRLPLAGAMRVSSPTSNCRTRSALVCRDGAAVRSGHVRPRRTGVPVPQRLRHLLRQTLLPQRLRACARVRVARFALHGGRRSRGVALSEPVERGRRPQYLRRRQTRLGQHHEPGQGPARRDVCLPLVVRVNFPIGAELNGRAVRAHHEATARGLRPISCASTRTT